MLLNPEQTQNIRNILKGHVPHATVYVFGSRADNTAKKFSDVDLLIDNTTPLSFSVLSALREDFTNSTLPFTIDLVDAHSIEATFRERLLQKAVQL